MTISSADQAYAEWLTAHPNATICTHWREAFAEGYEAALARATTAETTLEAVRVALGEEWSGISANWCQEFRRSKGYGHDSLCSRGRAFAAQKVGGG